MVAFEGIAHEYQIELRDKPNMVWDFHALLSAIQMMLSFMLTDETLHQSCIPTTAFFTANMDDVYCSALLQTAPTVISNAAGD